MIKTVLAKLVYTNRSTTKETLGVSASRLYPPGVDPNGRIFGEDDCGKAVVIDTCPTPIDGIVQPTGIPDTCGVWQGDLMLLGNNQQVIATKAVARINSEIAPTAAAIS